MTDPPPRPASGPPVATTRPRPWPGELEWGTDWASDTAAELANLGFVLRDGAHPEHVPGPRLLVAFRPAPTLRHFDPEDATYWVTPSGRGERRTLRRTDPPTGGGDAPFSWGRIVIADRIPVRNQFLAFGGRLLTAALDDGTLLAAFASRAPIVRWAGHSQGTDPITDDVGAFFARIRAPLAYDPELERRLAAAAPETFYAAFVAYTVSRLAAAARLRSLQPGLASWIDRERARLCRDLPAAWRQGTELLGSLEIA